MFLILVINQENMTSNAKASLGNGLATWKEWKCAQKEARMAQDLVDLNNAWRKKISSSFHALFLSNRFSSWDYWTLTDLYFLLPPVFIPKYVLHSSPSLPCWDQGDRAENAANPALTCTDNDTGTSIWDKASESPKNTKEGRPMSSSEKTISFSFISSTIVATYPAILGAMSSIFCCLHFSKGKFSPLPPVSFYSPISR